MPLSAHSAVSHYALGLMRTDGIILELVSRHSVPAPIRNKFSSVGGFALVECLDDTARYMPLSTLKAQRETTDVLWLRSQLPALT